MSEGLLLIDLQNDYFPGGRYPLSRPETALENARRVLSAFRAHGLPVFHIQHLNPPGAAFFLTGTSGAEIHGDFPSFYKNFELRFTGTAAYVDLYPCHSYISVALSKF